MFRAAAVFIFSTFVQSQDSRFAYITDEQTTTFATDLATVPSPMYKITLDGWGSIHLPPQMILVLAIVSLLAPLVSRLIYKIAKLAYRQARQCDIEYDPETSDCSSTSSDGSTNTISSVEQMVLQNEAMSILASHPLELPLTRSRLARSGRLTETATQTSTDEGQTYAKTTTEAVNIELKSLKEVPDYPADGNPLFRYSSSSL